MTTQNAIDRSLRTAANVRVKVKLEYDADGGVNAYLGIDNVLARVSADELRTYIANCGAILAEMEE